MNFEYKVIDDFIPKSYQEDIKNNLLSRKFPWYYIKDVTHGDGATENLKPAFEHWFTHNFETFHPFGNFLHPLAHLGAQIAGVKFNGVFQMRSFLQHALNPNTYNTDTDPLHIDMPDEHLVVLYYVTDADGDTIFVDKKWDPAVDGELDKNTNWQTYPELMRVTPKQGRAVVFDGRYLHTAEQPKTNSPRCILNINVCYKEEM